MSPNPNPSKPDRFKRGDINYRHLPKQIVPETTDGIVRNREGTEQFGSPLCIVISTGDFNDGQSHGLVVVPVKLTDNVDTVKLVGVRSTWVRVIVRGKHAAGKPFFVWMNPTRAHVLTHLSPKYEAMRNPETDFGLEEAALKQMDDNIGVALDWLTDNGLEDNTIVIFNTDNGAEVYKRAAFSRID